MSEQLTRELIERLAEVLGTTAPYVWEIYLRQQTIHAVVDFLAVVLFLATTTAGLVAGVRWTRPWVRANQGDAVLRITGAGVVGVLFVIATIWFWMTAEASVSHLLNPEFYALDALLRAARGGQ